MRFNEYLGIDLIDLETNEDYVDLNAIKPDYFYIHNPTDGLILGWLYEFRLQILRFFKIKLNYWGIRHHHTPRAKWLNDWLYIYYYIFGYVQDKQWQPTLLEKIHFKLLFRSGYHKEVPCMIDLGNKINNKQATKKEEKFYDQYLNRTLRLYEYSKDETDWQIYRMGKARDD